MAQQFFNYGGYQPQSIYPTQLQSLQNQPSFLNQQWNYPQQQVQQALGFNGRIVNNFEEVTANDVPMNTPFSIFPKADASEIQVKSWNANGTISTTTYKPILDDKSNQVTNTIPNDFASEIEPIKTQLEGIQKDIADLKDSLLKKPQTKQKKEAVDDV